MKVSIPKILLVALVFMHSCNKDEESESYQIQTMTFTDIRDDFTYKAVKIGEQWWMAENLTYETNSGSYAYEDNEENVAVYGRLYTLDAAREACPDGWHLPTDDEWKQLAEFIENEQDESSMPVSGDYFSYHIGKYLQSKTGWGGAGIDFYGFNGLAGGGYFHSSGYGLIEEHAFWWSGSVYSTPYNFSNFFYWTLEYGSSFLVHKNYLYIEKDDRFSVRCVRD